MQSRLLHRNITAVDIEASVRFYGEALGFSPVYERANAAARQVHVCDRQGTTLALTQFKDPPGFGETDRRPFGPYGYTHLAFYVDDMDEAADRVSAAGGTVLRHTLARYAEAGVEMMYCTDPNGVRVELMKAPETPAVFSHSGICVSTIADALPFFAALGFRPEESFDFSEPLEWVATITETPGLRQRVQMLRNANRDTIELLELLHPRGRGNAGVPLPNRFGLESITVALSDINTAAEKLRALGGDFPDSLRSSEGGIDRRTGMLPWDAYIELVALAS